jgi:hypothetical protein
MWVDPEAEVRGRMRDRRRLAAQETTVAGPHLHAELAAALDLEDEA